MLITKQKNILMIVYYTKNSHWQNELWYFSNYLQKWMFQYFELDVNSFMFLANRPSWKLKYFWRGVARQDLTYIRTQHCEVEYTDAFLAGSPFPEKSLTSILQDLVGISILWAWKTIFRWGLNSGPCLCEQEYSNLTMKKYKLVLYNFHTWFSSCLYEKQPITVMHNALRSTIEKWSHENPQRTKITNALSKLLHKWNI